VEKDYTGMTRLKIFIIHVKNVYTWILQYWISVLLTTASEAEESHDLLFSESLYCRTVVDAPLR
jgi:hypothetical protein